MAKYTNNCRNSSVVASKKVSRMFENENTVAVSD